MKNTESSGSRKPKESNWSDTPLFAQNANAQNKNSAPQITDLPSQENSTDESFEEINAEPQKLSGAVETNSSPVNSQSSAAEKSKPDRRTNAAPHKKDCKKENAVLHSFENAASHKSEKVKTDRDTKLPKSLKPVRREKLRPSSPPKKSCSTKRNAVLLKVFASPAEKALLENKAEKSGCSLSNYIRLHLGLPFNEAGRKKQKA